MIVRMAESGDAANLYDHGLRHFRESGEGGDPIFHPIEDFERWNREEQIRQGLAEWARSLTEPGWRRTWVVGSGGEIVGDCTLVGGGPAALHRCQLGIGVERRARGRGTGRQLMRAAIDWARAQPALDWIDLHVFVPNERAVGLYTSLGFVPGAVVRDRFRVRGRSIDDLPMSLRLRP